MKKLLLILSSMTLTFTGAFAADCSKDQVKAAIEKVCGMIEAKGKSALKDIAKFRYCGDVKNYAWIQDKDVKMVLHPIKPRLNKKDLTKGKVSLDKAGNRLFVDFDKMAKSKKEGGWVDYVWIKGEIPTPKTSFIKQCPGPLKWIAGSGIWK